MGVVQVETNLAWASHPVDNIPKEIKHSVKRIENSDADRREGNATRKHR